MYILIFFIIIFKTLFYHFTQIVQINNELEI